MMIDLDAIEKECQDMIADGLGFIAPKSCGNAEMVAVLVEMLRVERLRVETLRSALKDAGAIAFLGGDTETAEAIKGILQCEQ